jgi:cation transport ATPase
MRSVERRRPGQRIPVDGRIRQGGAAMALSSVSVAGNALLLWRWRSLGPAFTGY